MILQSQFLSFDEAFVVIRPKQAALKQREYLTQGLYPVIDQGAELVGGYSDDESLVVHREQPVIVFGDHTRCVKWVNFKFVVGADGTKILEPKNELDPRFAYYQLLSKELQSKGYARHFALLKKETFWAPPLDTQKLIVEFLDLNLRRLEKAKFELDDCKNLFDSLLRSRYDRLFDFAEFRTTLGEVSVLINGDRGSNYPSKASRTISGVRFINAGHLENGDVSAEGMDYISESHYELLGSGKVQQGDVLFCLRGSLGKVGLVKSGEPGAIASSLVILRPGSRILSQYLLRYFQTSRSLAMISRFNNGTAQPNLSSKNLAQFEIDVPSLENQVQILSVAERFEEQLELSRIELEKFWSKLKYLERSLLYAAFNNQLQIEGPHV